MLGNTKIQVRETYGNPTHSKIITLEELFDIYKLGSSKLSILTPNGYKAISEVSALKVESLEVVNLNFSIIDSKHNFIIDSYQEFHDFNVQEWLKAKDLNTGSGILTYTNTELKCWGFQLRQALANLVSIEVSEIKDSLLFDIRGNFTKFYADRLISKPYSDEFIKSFSGEWQVYNALRQGFVRS